MSYLAKALNTYLNTLAITPYVYNGSVPQNPTYPITVFDIVDENPFGRSHDAGVQPFEEARVQIDIYSTSIHQAELALSSYKAALGHYEGSLGVSGFEDVSIRYAGRNPGSGFQDEATLIDVVKRSLDILVVYK